MCDSWVLPPVTSLTYRSVCVFVRFLEEIEDTENTFEIA